MVLREGFEPERVTSAWEVSVRRWRVEKGGGQEVEGVVDDEEEEDVEDLWAGVVPEMGEDILVSDCGAGFVCVWGGFGVF